MRNTTVNLNFKLVRLIKAERKMTAILAAYIGNQLIN